MPKVMIYSDQDRYVRDDQGNEFRLQDLPRHPDAPAEGPGWPDTGGRPIYERGLKVGWEKGRQYVEIGCAEYETSTELAHDNGMFLTLDRDGINRLIKALRDARDQAYGKDQ